MSAIAVAKELAWTMDLLYVHQDLLSSVLQHPFMSATHQAVLGLLSAASPVTHVSICVRLNCSLNSSSLLLKTDCVYAFLSPCYSKIIIRPKCVCVYVCVYMFLCVCSNWPCWQTGDTDHQLCAWDTRTFPHEQPPSRPHPRTNTHAHTAGGHKQTHTDARSGCTQQVSGGFV